MSRGYAPPPWPPGRPLPPPTNPGLVNEAPRIITAPPTDLPRFRIARDGYGAYWVQERDGFAPWGYYDLDFERRGRARFRRFGPARRKLRRLERSTVTPDEAAKMAQRTPLGRDYDE